MEEQSALLHSLIEEGLTKKVSFEQRPKAAEKASHVFFQDRDHPTLKEE